MAKRKVEFASQEEIGYLSLWVDEIVSTVCRITGNRPPIFLSDLSTIGDFPLEERDFKALSEDLGVEARPADTFVDLAKRLKKARTE
jgi:hypothetical protein